MFKKVLSYAILQVRYQLHDNSSHIHCNFYLTPNEKHMTVLAFRDFNEINPDFLEEGKKEKNVKNFSKLCCIQLLNHQE